MRLVFEDDESDPVAATRKAERLFQQSGVDILVGPIHSGAALAVGQVAERADRMMGLSVAFATSLTGRACSPNVFRTSPHASIQATALARWLAEKYKGKRFLILGSDYELGRDSAAALVAAFQRNGAEVADPIFPPLNAPNFTTYFGQIRAAKPDIMVIITPGNDTVRLINQMKEYGLLDGKLVLAGLAGVVNAATVEGVKDAAEGFISITGYTNQIDSAPNRSLLASYKSANGGQLPDVWTAETYSLLTFIAEAGRKSGSLKPADFRKALRGLEWETPMGRRTMRGEDQQALMDLYITRLEGKNFRLIDKVPQSAVTWPNECNRF